MSSTKPQNSVEIKVRPQNKHLKPFPKGVSGNPKGHPKGQRNYKTIYWEAIKRIAKDRGITADDIETKMLEKGVKYAEEGDYRFYKDILDRLYGQPKQVTEIKGEIRHGQMETLSNEELTRIAEGS